MHVLKNIHCTSCTASRLCKVLLMCNRARDCHTNIPIFSVGKVLISCLVAFLSCFIYNFHEHEPTILFLCRVWFMCKSCCLRNYSNPVHLRWCWCASNALTFGSCNGQVNVTTYKHFHSPVKSLHNDHIKELFNWKAFLMSCIGKKHCFICNLKKKIW